jgi:2-amino-4-hydroxy-6-hydroxymethyldihydropteridine diphosphokinase
MLHEFVIGLGSNLGERGEYLARAASSITALPKLQMRALSRVFESPPLGPPQADYLNAALRVDCDHDARALLDRLLEIERALGRVRDVRWGPRVIDLDILWGTQRVDQPDLHVPHAHLRERAFALAPLLDVAPELTEEYASALALQGGAPARAGRLIFGPNSRCLYTAEGLV